MRNIFRDFENYFEAREVIITILLTGLFLFVSFVGYTRFATTEITDMFGEQHSIHISYYGFPFEMIGILNPIGAMEDYWLTTTGTSLLQVVWVGLTLNVVLYFLLAFALVYSFRRLRGSKATH